MSEYEKEVINEEDVNEVQVVAEIPENEPGPADWGEDVPTTVAKTCYNGW